MRHSDFRIGIEFRCGGQRWRCTDVGSRVVVAISLDRHEVVENTLALAGEHSGQLTHFVTDDPSWLVGPPYAVVERVFDEADLGACSLVMEPLP
jgi:hypothetical protein